MVLEKQLLDEHKELHHPVDPRTKFFNLTFSNGDNVKRQGFTKSGDEFLDEYNQHEEEITVKIIKFLHENPQLFRKIRFLQRKNKVFNSEKIPELDKLRKIKKDIIEKSRAYPKSPKVGNPDWLKNTDEEYQKMYADRGIKALSVRASMIKGEFPEITNEELNRAMIILSEGYRQAKIEGK